MSGQRPPATLTVPRTGLGSRAQESVDSFLKALKLHTRRLSSIMDAHAAELALLDRLYYKGKNQHGASLLWARVREMRRYAQRLRDLDLLAATLNLRASFYGETAPASSKKLKGSWTHYPDSLYLTWLLRRLGTAVELAEKTVTVMLRVFEWILLFMQNGEFLQMTVTFSALAARFRHLNVELRPLALLMHEDIRLVLLALYPGKAKRIRYLAPQHHAPLPLEDTASGIPSPGQAIGHDVELDEDLGVSLSRPEALPATALSRQSTPTLNTLTKAQIPSSDTTPRATPPVLKPSSVMHKAKPTVSVPTPKGAVVLAKKRKEPEPMPEPQKKVNKKKKAKRDEIDDIFG